jgi:hypothetical protein
MLPECWFATTRMVTRTRHEVTLYIHGLSCVMNVDEEDGRAFIIILRHISYTSLLNSLTQNKDYTSDRKCIFLSKTPRPALGPTQPPIQLVAGSFPRCQRAEA